MVPIQHERNRGMEEINRIEAINKILEKKYGYTVKSLQELGKEYDDTSDHDVEECLAVATAVQYLWFATECKDQHLLKEDIDNLEEALMHLEVMLGKPEPKLFTESHPSKDLKRLKKFGKA